MGGVFTVHLDLCQYGLVSTDERGTAPAMKPTTIITNMESAIEILGRRCRGGHRHVSLVDGRAGPCARYPNELIDAILQCVEMEMKSREYDQNLCSIVELGELHVKDEVMENCEEYGGYYDDLTGEPLDAKGVKKGRKKELEKLWARGVYEWVPRKVVQEKGAKIIKTKWAQNRKGKGEQGGGPRQVPVRGNGVRNGEAGRPLRWDAPTVGGSAAPVACDQQRKGVPGPDGAGRGKRIPVRGCSSGDLRGAPQ